MGPTLPSRERKSLNLFFLFLIFLDQEIGVEYYFKNPLSLQWFEGGVADNTYEWYGLYMIAKQGNCEVRVVLIWGSVS